VQYGFVIDQSRCIGCHACTVACKVENDVPLGSFRTWVKQVETGEFPQVRRSFAVLRCNQCTLAPCVTICPVTALEKRPDGIVDVDPAICIGCKACLQACPYDALHIHPSTGTAQKCHFCAHRVERGMAPACAVVCPTEAIIPGDFDDPTSRVARLRAEEGLEGRRLEAGTGPNVLYRRVEPAALDPARASAAGGFAWANRQDLPQARAEDWLARVEPPTARTSYDVQAPLHWGARVGAYVFTKSLGAGAFLAAVMFGPPLSLGGGIDGARALALGLLGLAALGITALLLVVDLKRPERFLSILLRPQWGSWLARGAFVLTAYGAVLLAWTVAVVIRGSPPEGALGALLGAVGGLLAAATAAYTAFLFAQAKGRVLWMRRSLALELVVHALIAGLALLMGTHAVIPLAEGTEVVVRATLVAYLAIHAFLIGMEGRWAPPRRAAEYARAHRLLARGPFALRHWGGSVGLGVLLPCALLLAALGPGGDAAAAVLVLLGLWNHSDLLVRAGQALPIH
jgi:Fe-S-cluster-containing dehydrogenase component